MASSGPYLQVALEEAPNHEAGANDVSTDVFYPAVKAITDDDGFAPLEEQDLIRGFLAPMPHLGAASYAPTMKLSGMHLRPNELGAFLYAVMGSCETAAGVGGAGVKDPDDVNVPVGAYRHVFSFQDADPPQSLQLIGASGDGKFRKAQGMGVESLSFKFEDGALTSDAALVGLVLKDISDPSLTPVIDANPPFRSGDMTLTWLDNTARTTAFTWEFRSQIEALQEPTVASLFPSLLLYQNDALPTIGGTIDKASIESADTAALLAGTQFAARIKVVGRKEIGTSGYYPALWIELPGCQLTKLDRDDIEAKRRRQGSYDWEARYDAASGALATVTLVNAQSSYASYS